MQKKNEHYNMTESSDEFVCWRYTNGQKYLEVRAPDHYTLGLLEGRFLRRKIWFFKIIIYLMTIPFFFRKRYTYKRFIEIACHYEEAVEEKYKDLYGDLRDEMRGMADSINGISYEDILLQNTYIELVYGHLIPIHRDFPEIFEFGCTGFAAIQNDTELEEKTESLEQANTLIGQNFDLSKLFKPTASFVLHKVKGRPKVFSLRFGSMLSVPTGLNEYGLKMTVNIVKSTIKTHPIIPTGIRTRMGFYLCRNVEEVYSMLNETSDSICYNLTVADKEKIISLEINPYHVVRTDVNEWIVRSNTFVDPSLQQYLLRKNYSKKRQKYAEELMKENYDNKLTEEKLRKILSKKPKINRSNTVAFFTDKHFGIGGPKASGKNIGKNPL
ncbi:MAG: hypothetical protein GF364_21520 [Candidatus Lokiarchaeota archaeon]|nr:hypothetical protein [Candidatus Lokiarchaeota archaeon]